MTETQKSWLAANGWTYKTLEHGGLGFSKAGKSIYGRYGQVLPAHWYVHEERRGEGYVVHIVADDGSISGRTEILAPVTLAGAFRLVAEHDRRAAAA